MWIRSQNKKDLINAKFFYVSGTKIITNTSGFTIVLGTYQTEERALEVLDDIQESIVACEITKTSDVIKGMANMIITEKEFAEKTSEFFIHQMPVK